MEQVSSVFDFRTPAPGFVPLLLRFWFPSPNARDVQSGFLSAYEELRNLLFDITPF
jgi:hypothetical protein